MMQSSTPASVPKNVFRVICMILLLGINANHVVELIKFEVAPVPAMCGLFAAFGLNFVLYFFIFGKDFLIKYGHVVDESNVKLLKYLSILTNILFSTLASLYAIRVNVKLERGVWEFFINSSLVLYSDFIYYIFGKMYESIFRRSTGTQNEFETPDETIENVNKAFETPTVPKMAEPLDNLPRLDFTVDPEVQQLNFPKTAAPPPERKDNTQQLKATEKRSKDIKSALSIPKANDHPPNADLLKKTEKRSNDIKNALSETPPSQPPIDGGLPKNLNEQSKKITNIIRKKNNHRKKR